MSVGNDTKGFATYGCFLPCFFHLPGTESDPNNVCLQTFIDEQSTSFEITREFCKR